MLYRDAKASFITAENHLMKIGTPEKEYNRVQVILFELKEGDIFIAGSDGRDDIILEGTDDVNHDENLFLSIVEKSEADIDRIVKEIAKVGNLKDDLSLLAVKFVKQINTNIPDMTNKEKNILLQATKLHKNNENKAALLLLKEHFDHKYLLLPVFNLIKRIYLVEKDYANYSKLLIRYHLLYPEKNENLLKISKALVLSNQLEQAMDYAECLRLREPFNEENLIHLAKIYKLASHYNVALRRLNEVFEVNPNSQEALTLKESIETIIKQTKVMNIDEPILELSKFDY